ncbi:lactose/L-arabinose transport system ATP-binding protein [Neorhizobium galegae]|uniref:ABC transporter ATP-binding protein n=1 Tax=Neorhizobium galegae TaxID=399 RepID=UPI001AE51082|nr:sn-glycerol-3-phosphate ABC transporter ATP-binding protein UgpC [Neorhizobium galegae]MBP2551636.1 lactose/L-arabinose transport system ATP-binding protein [Neorhizobium galegae]
MAQVELKDVSKRYGSVEVIRDLNLMVEAGSFTVLVGPSGCGKSTLLRMVAGLETISGGILEIAGTRANDLDPVARGVAMVFQNYALYPHMTVARNIGFALKIAGLDKAEVESRVREAADVLQIEHLLDRKPANLSGGQRQRVAIGRAIVRDPQVFLFDEPLSNLDAELRVSMRVELARLHQKLKATMLYVTHDQTEAMTLADKIVVMRDGRIEQTGTPEQLYSDPDNVFVAGFIGSPRMNFLSGEASQGLVHLAQGVTLPCPSTLSGPVSVGIRPEHMTPRGGRAHSLPVTIDMIEYLGGTRYLYGRLANETPVAIEARDNTGIRAGEQIDVTFDNHSVMLFDASGKRIRSAAPIPS